MAAAASGGTLYRNSGRMKTHQITNNITERTRARLVISFGDNDTSIDDSCIFNYGIMILVFRWESDVAEKEAWVAEALVVVIAASK